MCHPTFIKKYGFTALFANPKSVYYHDLQVLPRPSGRGNEKDLKSDWALAQEGKGLKPQELFSDPNPRAEARGNNAMVPRSLATGQRQKSEQVCYAALL
jgi:hypothetical protein